MARLFVQAITAERHPSKPEAPMGRRLVSETNYYLRLHELPGMAASIRLIPEPDGYLSEADPNSFICSPNFDSGESRSPEGASHSMAETVVILGAVGLLITVCATLIYRRRLADHRDTVHAMVLNCCCELPRSLNFLLLPFDHLLDLVDRPIRTLCSKKRRYEQRPKSILSTHIVPTRRSSKFTLLAEGSLTNNSIGWLRASRYGAGFRSSGSGIAKRSPKGS